MKTPLTSARLRQYLHYSWWKYVLLAVSVLFMWNIIFSVTAYRAPAHLKVNLYAYCYGDQDPLDAYLTTIRTTEMSDMEEMRSVFMTPDETYGPMQLMTYVAAAEGDLYILDKDNYQNYASQGLFIPLESIVEELGLEEQGTSLERSWRKETDSGERHLFGIPMVYFPGFSAFTPINLNTYYIGIAANSGNEENSVKLLKILYRDFSSAAQ